MPTIRITVDGKHALTVEQAAARYGLQPSSMRGQLTRLKQVIGEPAAHLDRRTPLYLAAVLDRAMAGRTGRGAPGMPRTRTGGGAKRLPPAEG